MDAAKLSFTRALCLYHTDPDGQCSAAIVRRALGEKVELFGLEIGDPLPWDLIDRCDLIVIVDYSLPLGDMEHIRTRAQLVWVDHHVSALDQLGSAMADVPGERTIDEAGCVLTWRTFFPDRPEPRAVIFIGDRDIWRHAHPETRPFGEGLYQLELDPANDAVWGPLLDDQSELVDRLIREGQLLYAARLREIHRTLDTYAFEVQFEGHRALAINDRGSGEMGEAMRQRGFEIGYCYVECVRSGRRQTFVTLYSAKVDVSLIARKFGGGGHRGAAGFAFERADPPFPESASFLQVEPKAPRAERRDR